MCTLHVHHPPTYVHVVDASKEMPYCIQEYIIIKREGYTLAVFHHGNPIHQQTIYILHFQISANPADINVLPEYSHDPRVVSNLLDGVNQTRDDLHMWLAPFTAGHTHTIKILFSWPITLAMIRIWVRSSKVAKCSLYH